jgi:two-component system sensor histidine kinase KdpD
MTAEALQRRMAHGNVYAAEKVDAALANYFRVGNLNALRELALLWTADRVDDALRLPRAARHHRTWEARERVVVALTGGHEGETLVPSRGQDRGPLQRRRPAGRARRPVGRPAGPARGRSPRSASWSSRSGGPTTRSSATTFRRHCSPSPAPRNATQLVLGDSRRTAWRACSAGRGRAHVRDSGDIDVHIVTHAQTVVAGAPPRPGQPDAAPQDARATPWPCSCPAAHHRADPVPRRAQPGQRHAALPAATVVVAWWAAWPRAHRRRRPAPCCSTTTSPRRCTR